MNENLPALPMDLHEMSEDLKATRAEAPAVPLSQARAEVTIAKVSSNQIAAKKIS